MPFDVDCGVGPNRVQNHAKTNRISPPTAEFGNVLNQAAVESVESFVAAGCSELLARLSSSQDPAPKLLACPGLPDRPARGPVPCMCRLATQRRASKFKWGTTFALDVSLAEI